MGVVLLKRLADAQNDKDIIQGVIKGWGVNQDGKTNGITAPNAESQSRLEQDVYNKFAINPEEIQLVEAHGTGTKLGDPIEVEGLKDAFKNYTESQSFCALGSVKSNIGHCLTAAGIAGIIKLILAFKHKQIPPTINYENLNEHIKLDSSPFYISEKLESWDIQNGQLRQAAISSFGFSGTNAHMVLSEYQESQSLRKRQGRLANNMPVVVPISARTADRLKQKSLDLIRFIQTASSPIDLYELSYTLQVGREPMEYRLAVIVSNIDQLVEKLQLFVDDESAKIAELYAGQVKRNKEGLNIISQEAEVRDALIANWIAQKSLSKLVNLWTKGLAFDWKVLYENETPQRMVLPNYPFSQELYWIEETGQDVAEPKSIDDSKMHPLLHQKTLSLAEKIDNGSLIGESLTSSKSQRKSNKDGNPLPLRIELPTYPFLRDRCWIEAAPELVKRDSIPQRASNFESIQEIIEQVDSGKIETDNAIKILKELA